MIKVHPKTRIILMYVIVIAILIDSTTMYRYLVDSPLYGNGFGWPVGILCLLYVLRSKQIGIDNSLKFKLPILLSLFFVYVVATGFNVKSFLVSYVGVFFCLFVFSYFLYQNHEMGKFMRAFSNVMIAVALLSLFFWFFGSVLDVLPGRKVMTYSWANRFRTTYTYYYLYFENPVQNSVHGTLCNLGIFTESPGYSGFLTYGLLVDMIFRGESRKKKEINWYTVRIVIYVITLITTNSTKGIIAVMIALMIAYVTKGSKNRFRMIAKLVLSAAGIAVVVFFGLHLLENKLSTSSGIVRMDDMISCFKTFIHNPVFGAGYNNVEAIVKYQTVNRKSTGLSMGIPVLFAYGGIWMASIYAGAVVASYRIAYFRQDHKKWFLVCTVLLYNLFISNVAFTIAYIFMIAAAYSFPSGKRLVLKAKGH